jgi:hypothetical protein
MLAVLAAMEGRPAQDQVYQMPLARQLEPAEPTVVEPRLDGCTGRVRAVYVVLCFGCCRNIACNKLSFVACSATLPGPFCQLLGAEVPAPSSGG